METEIPIEQLPQQQFTQPTITPPPVPRSNKKLVFIIGALVIVFLIIGFVGVFMMGDRQTTKIESSRNNSVSSTQKSNFKTYINSYYNFKLDIPNDWKVEEEVIKDKKYVDGEYQTFKLSSPNGDLTIDNTSIFGKNNHIKEQLPNTKVQLGIYTLDRYPYINDDNQRIDYIELLNVKRQDGITFTFNGDIEKNNELLLSILKTFAYTKQKLSLDEEIAYILPTGWIKEDTDTSVSLSFTSPDFHEEGLPTIVTGARITVNKTKKTQRRHLLNKHRQTVSMVSGTLPQEVLLLTLYHIPMSLLAQENSDSVEIIILPITTAMSGR